MKYEKMILSNTRIDRHKERMSLAALESIANDINKKYIPITVEHDPRIPPIGRIFSAKVKKLEDGEFALEGEAELFEESDEIPPINSFRELSLWTCKENKLKIIYDRSFRDVESQKLINEIGAIFGSAPEQEVKKAVEPLSTLIIGGSFILGSLAAGFFNKIGADIFNIMKQKLKELLRNKKSDSEENIFILRLCLNEEINVEIILTNPTDSDIEILFDNGIQKFEKRLQEIYDKKVGLRKIIFEYKNEEFKILYGLRKDCIPLSYYEKAELKLPKGVSIKCNMNP
ncbi:MAG: hypothetical protein WA666_00670 [Nitrospirota bacterium]